MKVKLSQYAKMSGVSVRTLWRRINDGSLPVVKSESCGLVNQRDLLAANNILKEGRRSLDDLTNTEVEVTKPVKCLEF